METSVVLAVVVYGLVLFGWGALCFLVGKYAIWPLVDGLKERLNGGLDEDEQYENELLSSMNRFQAKHDELVVRVDDVELLSNENKDDLRTFNERLYHVEDAAIKSLHQRLIKVEEYVQSVDESKHKIASRLNNLEEMRSFYEKKFDEIYANLKADNDSISKCFKELNSLKSKIEFLDAAQDQTLSHIDKICSILLKPSKKEVAKCVKTKFGRN